MSWLDAIFGSSTPQPARPTSRGATFGAGYQGLPTSSRIDDQRQAPIDYPYWMKKAPSTLYSQALNDQYSPSPMGGTTPTTTGTGIDPMPIIKGNISNYSDPTDVAPYSPSFGAKKKPSNIQSSINRIYGQGPRVPSPDPLSANIGPISPGDPGWTSPPSLSGPHNPAGDPARPGWGRTSWPQNDAMGTTLNSMPGWGQ